MSLKISVIMSVYNNEDYLIESIESILNQTYKNFEFIITNDCSNDNSLNIIKSYAEIDERIILIDNPQNFGLTKSLNNMIRKATGDLIARMDGDDIAFPNRFADQITVFKECEKVDFVFSDTILIDYKGNEICQSWRPEGIKDIIKVMNYVNYIPHPTVMVKKKIFDDVSYYNDKYKTGQDHELWTKFIKSKVEFYYLKKPLLFYRINPKSVRVNSGENKYFKLANICIFNKSKVKALNYFKYLNTKQRVLLLFKMSIPFKFLYYKGLMQKKRRRVAS
ncbi:hypothetical protein A361_24965 [Cytobacillus oceanisediminis 2691]|uniref:Glycosyltransferase 2-like domain-containing protein n=2 Tax=Cytobacillus oceanisediminis TaxID=665099 RepID=A0A160MG51_9BACI|nr:hypothetical protein A361_24965 [Cytobacillus oceanisediminis 2691]